MNFSTWLSKQPYGTAARIARETGVSYSRVMRAAAGVRVMRIDIARSLSAATGGEVSVDDFYDPPARSTSSEPPPATGSAA